MWKKVKPMLKQHCPMFYLLLKNVTDFYIERIFFEKGRTLKKKTISVFICALTSAREVNSLSIFNSFKKVLKVKKGKVFRKLVIFHIIRLALFQAWMKRIVRRVFSKYLFAIDHKSDNFKTNWLASNQSIALNANWTNNRFAASLYWHIED